jgi:glycosyltransferase involved in cell wall biosynthesis
MLTHYESGMPEVTIGLPVFNGAEFVGHAIEALLKQTYTRWRLVISDNASTDSTYEILTEYALRDSRIQVVRQEVNGGAINNFIEVAQNVETPFFMWMAADDVMEPRFLEKCIGQLKANPDLGMAFSLIRNIDTFGREVRSYPHLHQFSGPASFRTIFRYLNSPEAMGKANLIYSLYRTNVCQYALSALSRNKGWGFDMAFVLRAISLAGIVVEREVLFNKRLVRPTDEMGKVDTIVVPDDVYHQSCPLEYFPEYKYALLHSVKGTRFWLLAWAVVNYRFWKLSQIRKKLLQPIPPTPQWKVRVDRILTMMRLK